MTIASSLHATTRPMAGTRNEPCEYRYGNDLQKAGVAVAITIATEAHRGVGVGVAVGHVSARLTGHGPSRDPDPDRRRGHGLARTQVQSRAVALDRRHLQHPFVYLTIMTPLRLCRDNLCGLITQSAIFSVGTKSLSRRCAYHLMEDG